ncbi:ABC transporter family protein [Mesorhizobium loti]|uniref:ABC transporter family protein n=1 Tax=Rhizobium loti TaxID=381 RepID=A0A8E3B0T0_RHILI|nr:ATP-binding cassette domain-containing protein [Mesorhizobium loti]PWJ82440.1 ABC transporter family protein [Mesorhizobium loti]
MTKLDSVRGAKGDVILDVKGLRIGGKSKAGWAEIVKGIDLTLRRGEILGLIGESGAGKSTIAIAVNRAGFSGGRFI